MGTSEYRLANTLLDALYLDSDVNPKTAVVIYSTTYLEQTTKCRQLSSSSGTRGTRRLRFFSSFLSFMIFDISSLLNEYSELPPHSSMISWISFIIVSGRSSFFIPIVSRSILYALQLIYPMRSNSDCMLYAMVLSSSPRRTSSSNFFCSAY